MATHLINITAPGLLAGGSVEWEEHDVDTLGGGVGGGGGRSTIREQHKQLV